MEQILLKDGTNCSPILVEKTADAGIARIAEISAADIEQAGKIRPTIYSSIEDLPDTGSSIKLLLVYATLGKSAFLDEMIQKGKVDVSKIRGKREVYGIFSIDAPIEHVDQALLICGSDKRGTIYGIFTLSEAIGITPMTYWGDIKRCPAKRLYVTEDLLQISEEPSVRYRGFFINDEWPCFGTWAVEHFGGFNAKMYEKVFELLLRLKGNFFWPAMWSASFALDGPGNENERLAELYGIIIGNSHHEPCLRASEEWDIYKGEDTPYGTAWNYATNKEGLLEYWKDGLKRSGKQESIITIGMRGERDSKMEGTTTLQDNINILKDIITRQEALIQEYTSAKEEHPRMLAIYKEVEQYYYGDENTPGLMEWEGLKNTILMFCEDNFGYMRYLPQRPHARGYGMYYHLDYHGSPVSYEWINTTPLTKIWEEMTKAYAYGVSEVWMVNVGDLKGNEYPLSYFMALAYDQKRWGEHNRNSAQEYCLEWNQAQWRGQSQELIKRIAKLQTETIALWAKRRPETLAPDTFHPVHEKEADRILEQISHWLKENEQIKKELSEEERSGYYSLIEHALVSGLNLARLHIYAGKNAYYAAQAKPVANQYRTLSRECIRKDRECSQKLKEAFDGKWSGMELESHIGFQKWNEDGRRYPVLQEVIPLERPVMFVSKATDAYVACKNYGVSDKIEVDEFLAPSCEEVQIEIANAGEGHFRFEMEGMDVDWLDWTCTSKEVYIQEILSLHIDRTKMKKETEETSFYVTDGDTKVEIHVCAKQFTQQIVEKKQFIFENDKLCINAAHFCDRIDQEGGRFEELKDFGRTGSGVKVFPANARFSDPWKSPGVRYYFQLEKEGNYQIDILTAPCNPVCPKDRLRFGVQIDEGDIQIIESVGDDYQAGEPDDAQWCKGVLDQIRTIHLQETLDAKGHALTLYGLEPGIIFERIVIHQGCISSYLGPQESLYLESSK